MSFRFLSCNTCGSVFRTPPYFETETYPDDYYGEDADEKFWFSPVFPLRKLERDSRAKYLTRKARFKTAALDIGCGNGKLLKHISRLNPNCSITGIELDSKAARRAAKIEGIRIFNQGLHRSDLGEDKFSIISMIHSFEHIANPEKTIQKLSKISNDNCLLYIAIPNRTSFQFNLFGKHWFHLDPEWHLHFIRPETLIIRLEKEGFEYVKSKHFNPVQNMSGFIISVQNLFTRKRNVFYDMLMNRSRLKKIIGVIAFLLYGISTAILFFPALIEEFLATLFRRGATIDMIFEKKSTKPL
ncbi:MAG: hypothetical protein C0592_12075 [Marinilabiliales bacterium]|nr:MAG: hypothetical protein C0592_12075 [Marinilabiliales bacterium]